MNPNTMKRLILSVTLTAVGCFSFTAFAADLERQARVAKRGTDVMPFSLKAASHVFTKTAEGGAQRVVAQTADSAQVKLVRSHLNDIQTEFLNGDFSGPSHIHGNQMPVSSELKAANPGQITIDYTDVKGAQS